MAKKKGETKKTEGKDGMDKKDKAVQPVVDEKLKEKADNKVSKDGWIRASMMIEVLAMTEGAAKTALEKHVDALAKEKWVMVYKRDYSELQRVENPLPRNPEIKEGFSYVAELECAVQRYEDLIHIVMHYGPSAVEILEPVKIILELGEAQGILNSLADLIHKFVAAGVGGVVVKT